MVCAGALLGACIAPRQGANDDAAAGKTSVADGAAGRVSELPELSDVTEGLRRLDGLFTLWIDDDAGTVKLQLPPPRDDSGTLASCLAVEGLRTGLGSNPIGLDRGQWGDATLIEFRRHGRRVLIHQPNLAFRAALGRPSERLAATESFATSVLWGTDIVAENADGRCLIDLSGWLLRDAHGSAGTLGDTGQGSWSLDGARSAIDTRACLACPDNVEFEALLTFAGQQPGSLVSRVTPRSDAVTLVQHQSLVRLPDDDYQPLALDPRAGAWGVSYSETSAALEQPTTRRLAMRHRLQSAGDTIVYYVDRGVPEPVRSALLSGASWWTEAFAAAGYPDAFRVELLPLGIHPFDVRYHVIEWVHRATRGWSYGHAISDPRSGEIIKAHVSLGALRVRQDQLLFEGLLGVDGGDNETPSELALARIRQLAAHEVGHTLGLAHNFAGSILGNGSVMDYPAPYLTLDANGAIDASAAYGVGIGPWDRLAIAWLYGAPEAGQREPGPGLPDPGRLDALIAAAAEAVPPYLSDADARAASAAEPRASLWDTGSDPVQALQRTLAVRATALAGFDAERLAPGRSLSELGRVFTPVYLHHRYQLEAAIKVIGGVLYEHSLSGDGRPAPRVVDGRRQRTALEVVLSALEPAALDIPDRALALLVPPTPDAFWDPERLPGRQGLLFDPLEAAAVAAQMVVAGLLQPQRCARLIDQRRREEGSPALHEVLDALLDTAYAGPLPTPRLAPLARVAQRVVADGLVALARNSEAAYDVRAAAEAAITRLMARLTPRPGAQDGAQDGGQPGAQPGVQDGVQDGDEAWSAHRALLRADLERHLSRRGQVLRPRLTPAEPPPGSPIGGSPIGGSSLRGQGDDPLPAPSPAHFGDTSRPLPGCSFDGNG